jgi:hypothetical protein
MPLPRTDFTVAHRLSVVIAVLMLVASAGGLAIEGLYRDNLLVTAGWYGNDLVTLVVAVPLLAVATARARRGSRRAELVWLGMLAYTIYNYAFYVFGSAFNGFFLLYVCLLTLSILALMFGVASLEPDRGAPAFNPAAPAAAVAGYMLLVTVLLGSFWIVGSLGYVFTGDVPAIVTVTGGHTNIVAALDLSMVVSFGVLGAIWLRQRRPWGFVLATIWNVKGAVYMAALSAASVSAYLAGASSDLLQVALWAPIGAGCLASSVALLRNVT